jgi:mersacidin/lichenicidin family type 2 lantibiotic
MSKQNIIRAWKDENYRRSLSEAERAALPESPAGRLSLDELTAAELAEVQGGNYPIVSRECSIGGVFQGCHSTN